MRTRSYRVRRRVRRVNGKVGIALFVAGSCVAGLFGQTDDSPITYGQYRRLQSNTLGEERILLIRLPADYEKSAKRYPVLYKLDGDTEDALQAFAEINYLAGMTNAVPDHVVVGVANTDRARDMGPGADKFMQFLAEELVPFISRSYRTSGFSVLCGQSASSIFVMRQFLKQPATFNGYLLASFGLGEANVESFRADLEKARLHNVGRRYLFITNGKLDGLDRDGSRGRNGERFLDLLKATAPPDVLVKYKVYEDEGHVPFPSLYDGLKWIYSTEKRAEQTSNEGVSVDEYPDIRVTRLSQRMLQLKIQAPGFFSTNVVVVATQKGLVVIDTWHSPFIFGRIGEIVKQQFGRRDFAYVINSHEDVDHASGDGFFSDAVMVGHENLFKALKATQARWRDWQTQYRGRIQGYIKGEEEKLARLDPESKEAKELMPGLQNLKKLDQDFERGFPILPENPRAFISFNDSLKLDLGDITIELYACKEGHTPSDILISIPEEGFLFTGDAAQPAIRKNANIEHWLAQLAHFASPDVKAKMILSGHDERPAAQADLERLRDYLGTILESIGKAREQGLSLEQIQSQCSLDNEMSRFRSLAGGPFNFGSLERFKERHRNNIETIFNLDK